MFVSFPTLILLLLLFVAKGLFFPVVIQNTQRVTGGQISMELSLNALAFDSQRNLNHTYLLSSGPTRVQNTQCKLFVQHCREFAVRPFISILLGCFPVDGSINTDEFPCANMTAIITRSTDAGYIEKHLMDKFSPNLWNLDYDGRKYYTVGWGQEHIYILSNEQFETITKIELKFELIDCAAVELDSLDA